MSRVPIAELAAAVSRTIGPGPISHGTLENSPSDNSLHEIADPDSSELEFARLQPLPRSLSRIPDIVGDAIAASDQSRADSTDEIIQQSDEERELAAALAVLLARRPARPTEQAPATTDPGADEALAIAIATPPVRSYVSALGCQPGPVEPDDDGIPTARADTALWLAAARRRHWRDSATRAGGWIAAVAIGSVIVAAAALILFGIPHEIGSWFMRAP